MSVDFAFAENTHRCIGGFEDFIQIGERNVVAVSAGDNRLGRRRSVESNVGNGQAENGAGVKREFRQVLRNHCYHAGVVRTGGNLAENDLVALDEHFDAENTASAQRAGDLAGNFLSFRLRFVRHGLRLPGFLVVAVNLMVSNRFEERRSASVTNGQEGNLVIEIDKPFDDNFACAGASAFLSDLPAFVDVVCRFANALSVSGRGHNRLDNARSSDFFNRLFELFVIGGESVRRRRQTELFSRQTANPFAVHGQERGVRSRDNRIPFFFQFDERWRGNRFDFRNDVVGLFLFDDFA